MTEIVALILDRDARARFRESLCGRAALRFVETCAELEGVAAHHGLDAVILGLRDREGLVTAPTVRRLRERFPLVPVVAYCASLQPEPHDLLAVVQAGVSGLVYRGFDDFGVTLRAALLTAEDDCLARRAMAELAPLVPPPARLIVEYCVTHAREAPTVEELARNLGMHRKTLVYRLANGALPSPQTLIGWSRLLLVGRLLESPERRVEHVALQLGFPSAASMRNMLKRYTGLQPKEVRENGGFACILFAFRQSILARRASRPAAHSA